MTGREILVAAGFAAASAAALAIGGALTDAGMGPWYDALEKPPFQPPGAVFGPAWFTIMGLAAWGTFLVWRRGRGTRRWALARALWAVQLVLNVGWSFAFFTLHRPAVALAVIAALTLVVLGMIACYRGASRAGALMLAPYAAWLGFAACLNVWIVVHNPT